MVIYEVGDLVFQELPAVYTPRWQNDLTNCCCCLEKCEDLRRCANCCVTRYCGKDCQRNDWKAGHRYECVYFKAMKESRLGEYFIKSMDMWRLPFRLYLLNENEPNRLSRPCKAFNGEDMNYDRLMDHEDEIKEDPKMLPGIKMLHAVFTKIASDHPELKVIKKDQFTRAFRKIVINSISMRNDDEYYGRGLYMAFSRINHSCLPLCHVVFKGLKIEVRCIRRFDSEKDEVNFSYTDPLAPRDVRRAKLMEEFCFVCHCKRCDNDNDIYDFPFYSMIPNNTSEVICLDEMECLQIYIAITSKIDKIKECSLKEYLQILMLIQMLSVKLPNKYSVKMRFYIGEYMKIYRLIYGSPRAVSPYFPW